MNLHTSFTDCLSTLGQLPSRLSPSFSRLRRHIPKAATAAVLGTCFLGVGLLEADPLEARRASAQAYCDQNAWDLPNCEGDKASHSANMNANVTDEPVLTVVTVDWSEIAAYLDADATLGREDAEAGWSPTDFPEARPQRLAAAY
jgi:hypothetical protein